MTCALACHELVSAQARAAAANAAAQLLCMAPCTRTKRHRRHLCPQHGT